MQREERRANQKGKIKGGGRVISISTKGSFSNSKKLLKKMSQKDIYKALNSYGEKGVMLLSSATPTRSGKTANSWSYEIEDNGSSVKLIWTNSNIVGKDYGVNVAVILQTGHGTGTGGYVRGIDYINPALRPLFQEIADSIWREVVSV